MSVIVENIICGLAVEVIKTCYVYGKKWIEIYRNSDDHRANEAVKMERIINRLLFIKEFYVENWSRIPHTDRIMLGYCLERIHAVLTSSRLPDNALLSFNAGDETFIALRPAEVRQNLAQITEIGDDAFTSSENSREVTGLFQKARREIENINEKVAYAVVGRDRTARMLNRVNEWIAMIDEQIGARSQQLVLRGTIAIEEFTKHIQSVDLPITINNIGLLLTNPDVPGNTTLNTTLNLPVTEFNSSDITTMIAREKISSLAEPEITSRSLRFWATFYPTGAADSQEVVIELKPIYRTGDALHDEKNRKGILKQTRSLIQALQIGARDSDRYHVLDCIGYFQDYHAIGLIFKPPFTQTKRYKCVTLNSLLLEPADRTLLYSDINNRICLAKALAWTLLNFHSAKWVHKSFRSENILLFRDITAAPGHLSMPYSWGSPFLVGFDSARLNTAQSDPLYSQPMQWQYRVYTHPDRLGNDGTVAKFVKFSKRHDIYSLGVVLLELGQLCPFTAPRFTHPSDPSKDLTRLVSSQLQKKLKKMAGTLRAQLGSIYADVTIACLEASFGVDTWADDVEDTLLSEAFKKEVCVRLETIQV